MRILLTGATGFIGRALVPRLLRDGHQLTILARHVPRALSLLGSEVTILPLEKNDQRLAQQLSGQHAVINLAGENIFRRRWTKSFKQKLVQSRVDFTRRLANAISLAPPPRPAILICASAAGFYGHRGSDWLDEKSAGANDFLANLCRDWEKSSSIFSSADSSSADSSSANPAPRTINLRFGLVLGSEGGALALLRSIFSFGLGARLGRGEQFCSWIHLDDVLEGLVFLLQKSDAQGPYNFTAPFPVTNRDFTYALARALHRPAFFRLPEKILRFLVGAAATVLLSSQRIKPTRLLEHGYHFRFPQLPLALNDLLNSPQAPKVKPAPQDSFLVPWPDYELSLSQNLHARAEEPFQFFARPENLGLLLPAWLRFTVDAPIPEKLESETKIHRTFRLLRGLLPVRWFAHISEWTPPQRFVETQIKGPFALWHHTHQFSRTDEGTLLEDRLLYKVPLDVLGKIANYFFIAPMLRRIFDYRRRVLSWRFGTNTLPANDLKREVHAESLHESQIDPK